MASAAPTALALEIKNVRQRVGSHDKLVATLKDRYGLGKASRTLVINWEKNSVPSGRYRDALVDLGVDEKLFVEPDPVTQPAPIAVMQAMQEALANQHEMRGRLSQIDRRLEELEGAAADIADAVTQTLVLLRAAKENRKVGRG